MSRHQVRELANRPDFFGDVIMDYLKNNQRGNYKRRGFETELKAMGVQNNVNDNDGRKYEAVIWDGYVAAGDLAAAGVDVKDKDMADHVEAVVWVLDGKVIKAEFNPWVVLDVDNKVNSYHHFIFEEDESTLFGNGLPNIMRDSQMSVAATARMLLDNASITCGPQLEMNTALLDQNVSQDVSTIRPYKIWYRAGTGTDAQVPMIKDININSHMDELLKVMVKFEAFADQETFIGPATGGDMQKTPSEPFRTAAGASMLRGDAALPFKDVVRNFDLFTQSVLGSIVAFNRQFNEDQNVQGDTQVIPRGATSLVAKEVRGMAIDQMTQILPEEEKRYLNHYEMLQERLRSRDFDPGDMVCSKEEAQARDKAAADQATAQAQQMAELGAAEIRKTLAEAVKNVTQSDKNAAGADAATVKTTLDALQAGALHEPGDPASEAESAGSAKPQGGTADGGVQQPSGGGAAKPSGSARGAPAPKAAASAEV
jgi:ribosomal protein L22